MSAAATAKPIKDRASSTSQKFWPLKKFNLSHGKTTAVVVDQNKKSSSPTKTTKTNTADKANHAVPATTAPAPVPAATATNTAATPTSAAPVTTTVDETQQKKSKNKRLSSLLSSTRHQEDESLNSKNASNTPTITRKAGREMKARTIGRNTNYMTAKTAGSGALTRTQQSPPSSVGTVSPPPPPSTATAVLSRAQSMASKTSTTRKPSKHSRPQSPPSRQSAAAAAAAITGNDQPKIMLESVQQQIQQEEKEKIRKQQRKQAKNSTCNDVDYDSAIEDELEDDNNKQGMIHGVVNATTVDNNSNDIKDNKGDVVTACISPSSSGKSTTSNSIQSCSSSSRSHSSSEICSDTSSSNTHQQQQQQQQHASPFPSPPVTPAATFLPDEFSIKEAVSSGGPIKLIHSEPASPTICTFDVQSVQQQHPNHTIHMDIKPNSLYVQQPIQRIHRLRPAASFATLRQIASTNSNYQHQQQQQQQPVNYIQHLAGAAASPAKTKRRPVSYIELSSNMNYNYAMASPPAPATSAALHDDYLSVHSTRPTYNRRASSEDHRQHCHTRQISDSHPSPPSSIFNGVGRRLVRSNTVHNLIIKDGQGHRIVQCVGLDDSPPLQPLRKKTSSFEFTSEYQDWPTTASSTTAAATSDILDDGATPAIVLTRQQLEDLHFQAQQQQQPLEVDASLDPSAAQPSPPLPQQQRPRKMKRKDSAKSLSSLCSTSPPINHDLRCEQLKNKLEKERATVKALQKQKEAYNKDVLFLSKNVDELSTDNQEWKRKFEIEKSAKERFQDDLSSTMDKLNEATEQIRQLESQSRLLKQEIDDKNAEIRELEKNRKSKSPVVRGKSTTTPTEKSSDRSLAAQLQHSQNQVRLLKSTMEQFLRMGVFNDDLSSMTSPTTSIDAVVSELRCGRTRQFRHPTSTTAAKGTGADQHSDPTSTTTSTTSAKSRKSLVPVDTKAKEPIKNNKSTPTAELDNQLLELLREKEILQAEYSKAPSSGGNALVRRRREELESRLDTVDSQMCRIKLKMLQERERRPNAGSRMRALLDQEVDMEELFEYRDSDEEDEEFSTKVAEEEEEDKVDSDFDLDSSEGEQEHIQEGEAMDKELDKAEKRARRAATFNPPPSAAAKPKKVIAVHPEKKPSEKRKRRSRSATMDQDEKGGERSTRFSSRKNTVLNRLHVEDQLREHEKRRALLPKRDRPVINKLTQAELLAEAAITEEINRDSLLEWQQMEAERKANAKKKDKRGMFGQFVRYYSFAETDGPVVRNGNQDDKKKGNNEAVTTTDISNTVAIQSNMDADTTMTDANGPDWQISNSADLMGRNLVSFMDNSILMDVQQPQEYGKRGSTEADKDLENADLIDQLSDWLVRPSKPNRPVICPITGQVAKYKDPSTGIPYANITAFQIIRACLHHDMRWASTSGIYLGYIPSAKGVPEGWDAAI
ncbi:vacuolar protein sorting-associated protein 72 homolog [Mucor ambiguus]|uniref:Vacuolar protein sorting-associated protein 72 homolog n=1 Tax=Mucor ambiguus TaxID=91626 RepID=A0A0C9MFX2_9FUNG|nr:vacuolar protein sorting-associated protein 72 homolog [Mucor ambiguus]